jgi:putative endonuclease
LQNLRSSFSFSRADPAYVLRLETKAFGDPSGTTPAFLARMSEAKCCVYVLRSRADPTRYYTGVTSDWRARLEAHNAGRCLHTANGQPWQIDVVVEFADERRAVAFERYLKSGSGCAFAKRHLR